MLIENDAEIAQRAQRGDKDALGYLIQKSYAAALKVAKRYGGTNAEDVVQDAALNACKFISRKNDDIPFRNWFLKIVRNALVSNHRYNQRREKVPLEEIHLAVDNDPLSELINGDLRSVITHSGDLSPSQKETILLHLDGYSLREIGDLLGQNRSTISMRYNRGIALLERKLQDVEYKAPSTRPRKPMNHKVEVIPPEGFLSPSKHEVYRQNGT